MDYFKEEEEKTDRKKKRFKGKTWQKLKEKNVFNREIYVLN